MRPETVGWASANLWSGLGQPVVLHRADGGEQRLLQQLLADLEGGPHRGDQTGKPAELLGLVERLAERGTWG